MDEVPLSDEPLPRERKRRPRWVGALGIAAAIAIVLFVGTLGDEGKDDATPAPSSTALPTSTTTVPETITTTTPATVEFGQILPRKTGTVVALLGGNSPKLLDLDTGRLTSMTYGLDQPMLAGDHGFLALQNGYVQFVPSSGAPPVDVTPRTAASGETISGTGTAWLRNTATGEWSEIDGRGSATGRSLRLPVDAYPVAAVDAGLVVAQHGSITLLAPGGQQRPLGAGDVLGGSGRTVVREACESLRCHIDLLDVATGGARRVAGPLEPSGAAGASFAPGGRWISVRMNAGDRSSATLGIIDLRDSSIRWLGPIDGPAAFTADGTYLLAIDGGTLHAYDIDDRRWILAQVGTTATTLLAVAG